MKTTARYLRIESWCDKALAWIIQLPPPLSAAVVLLWIIGMPPPWTFIVTVSALVGAFVAGLML